MSVTMPRVMLLAFLLSCFSWPSSSWALGLGEIHLNSALNEPMNAEIDLLAASPDELTALRATLASREAFTRYGIDKPPFLSTLTFKVGKGKDGRDALLVRSTDAIPEPFVTFLVEVNWARGRLMREYTVLLDPPVYTPGEAANSSAPVTAASSGAAAANSPSVAGSGAAGAAGANSLSATGNGAAGAAGANSPTSPAQNPAPVRRAPASDSSFPSSRSSPAFAPLNSSGATSVTVGRGDTLSKIAHSLSPDATPAAVDQTMISLYRSNPEAFGGNINVLRQGAVLRVPNADQIAALNQKEAMGEVHRQMDAWRGSESATPSGHLRLVTPSSGGSATGAGNAGSATADANTQALKDRVKDLEAQLAESKRLIDIRNNELSALQRKLGAAAPSAPPVPSTAASAPAAKPATPTPSPAAPPAVVTPPPVASSVPPPSAAPPEALPAPPAPPVPSAAKQKPAAAPDTGSWMDWVAANWWVLLVLLAVALVGLGFAAMKRRRRDEFDIGRGLEDTDVADPPSRQAGALKGNESFVVEESGPHAQPDFAAVSDRFGSTGELTSPDDTMSSESAVNLDQGDPLAEADFHMAYGLYDQAADLVRIALEREPERRDLQLKLLEIYFVWGNKDAFLQTAKNLEATRDRAPAGEWDKIVIMGKQICPDDPLFASSPGGGRGAGTLVDLNLEGGENRVDIDLFGDPEGERSTLDPHAKQVEDTMSTHKQAGLHAGSDLDFTLDAPERGADESPTREMPPRDEPTVESELMNFADANFIDPLHGASTTESPTLKNAQVQDHGKTPPRTDQTAEVQIDDLGLDLDQLEETGSPSVSLSQLEETDHPADAPTMLAGLDQRSRQMMADAERSAREQDMTDLERELEASFVSNLDAEHDNKTAIYAPESAPTVSMPRDPGMAADLDSTSKLRGLGTDGVDMDLDRLASALHSGDTVDQPRAEEDLFSSEVFDATQRNKLVDLDVGDPMAGSDSPTNNLQAQTNRLKPLDLSVTELEPVTMSEVGTKLDLARAYMDMGDPEGARSILEEVVQEGSASQKQEASRLIESLPG